MNKAAAAATIVYYVGHGARSAVQPSIALGVPAPQFVASALGGGAVSPAGVAGRPLVLAFFNTSCGWCLADLALLDQYARAHPEIAVVALDREEDAATVRAFLGQAAAAIPAGLAGSDGQAATAYTVDQLPATFFIDRHGTMRSYNFGPLGSMQSLSDQATAAARGVNNTY